MVPGDTRWQQRFSNFRRAFGQLSQAVELCKQRELWMAMIRHRKLSTHTYDEATIQDIISAVQRDYIHAFASLDEALLKRLEP